MRQFPEVGDIFEQRYELLEVLGSGGYGTVFKARQTDADRLIALKVLHSQNVVDEEFRQRFLREGQALSKLCHANIVTVYHLGLSEIGLPYLAMEFINGESLRKSLTNGKKLPAQRIFKIMKQLCSALSCMHDAGIFHRDLKPENIMLMQEHDPDAVKIIDFGLVKLDTNSDQKLTATGLLIGSVNYMSPEQCKGNKADARSDIYALSICMYEMLSGETPFTSDNPVGLMYKHVNLPPPELRLATGQPVHPSISEFIQKGLEKNPAFRFQSAAEMDEALSKLADQLSEEMPASAASDKTFAVKQIILLGFVLLCTLVFVSALFFLRQTHQVQEHINDTTAVRKKGGRESYEREYKNILARAEKTFGFAKALAIAKGNQYNQELRAVEETQALGPNDPDVATSLDHLDQSFYNNADLTETKPLYKRTKEESFGVGGLNNQGITGRLLILANHYRQERKLSVAESLYRRALAIKDNQFSWGVRLGLANCYFDQGKEAKAEAMYKSELALREKLLGPNSLRLVEVLDKLAECYERRGKQLESEPLRKRARLIQSMAEASDHGNGGDDEHAPALFPMNVNEDDKQNAMRDFAMAAGSWTAEDEVKYQQKLK